MVNVHKNYETLVQNSVFWGNDEKGVPTLGSEITRFSEATQSIPAKISVRYSDVEGGLTASTHLTLFELIDLDPEFASGINFRVPTTSPIVEAGDPETATNIPPLIPVDEFDLDGDGDTTELTPDHDLFARLFDIDNDGTAIVDMGVYESFPSCCEDVAGFDHIVNITDLLAVLTAWGPCPDPCLSCTINTPDTCPEDTNRDCQVDAIDRDAILAAWGPCVSNSCDPCSSHHYSSTEQSILLAYARLDSDGTRLTMDEFEPDQSTAITQISWWGFYEQSGANCAGGYQDSFTITYYETITEPSTDKIEPDSVLASFNNVSLFVKVESGQTLDKGIPLYFYNVSHAAVNVTEGATYIVEISNTGSSGSRNCKWRWATRND